MLYVPGSRAFVVNVEAPFASALAVPALPVTGVVPSVVPPLLNVIVPAGATPALSRFRKLAVMLVELPAITTGKSVAGVPTAVTAGTTLKLTAALVLALKLASPGNDAVRLLPPPDNITVCNSATPSLVSGAVPKSVLPVLNVIVPVAAPFGLLADALFPYG